jgi:hypothetical protein
MEPTDPAVDILKEIRDEVRTTNERVEGLRGEVRGLRIETSERFEVLGDEVQGLRTDVNDRFGETNDRIGRLERRQTESDLRVSTELVAVAGAVREVRDLLRGRAPAAGG